MKTARETVGQLHIAKKFATIVTPGGKRRLNAKLSARLRKAKLTEAQLGKIMDDGVRSLAKVELVEVKVWLPKDLVAIGPQIADSVGRLRMDHTMADALHDFARDAGLPTAVKDREAFAPLYDLLG